jgi:tRNA(fMet)-specific endonuclease VapC
MAILIDTTVLIGMERRGFQPADLGRLAPSQSTALSSVTVSEMLVGVHRANSPDRATRREAFIESILALLPVLPFDLPASRVHARITADLLGVGQPVAAHDLLIAATALTYGYGVLTENGRDFDRVPGLIVHRPAW